MYASKSTKSATTCSTDGVVAASGALPHLACDDLGVCVASRNGGVSWFSGKEASMADNFIRVRRATGLVLTATMALLVALFDCNPVFAQTGTIGSPAPGVSATTPLAMAPGSPISSPGIPLGSTELASPGLSPLPASPTGLTTGTTGTAGSGSTCSALGMPSSGVSSSGISGASTLFDGGGMAAGPSSSGSTAGLSATGC
jgi:hypothetical protein